MTHKATTPALSMEISPKGKIESRVLFLDFNGVIDSGAWYTAEYHRRLEATGVRKPLMDIFDPEAVARLNTVIEVTGACIVITSSMRLYYSIGQLFTKLTDAGFRYFKHVIGTTPDSRRWRHSEAGGGLAHEYPEFHDRRPVRGDEIRDWLRSRNGGGYIPVECYAIIDDDSDMLPEQLPVFVQTTNQRGLEDNHRDRLIELLSPNQAPAETDTSEEK